MKKSIIRLSLKILIVFLILISFNLLASANNQAPEISEKEVSELNYNISIESSLNYDINLDDSARATIYLEIENLNENDLFLEHIYFKVKEVPGKITNVKVESPRRKPFNKSYYPCSSHAECFQNLRPYEYCYNETKASNTTRYKCFCVAINSKLEDHHMTNLYIFYSTDNITDRSKNNTKYLFVPSQRFDNFWVRIHKYEYSRDNIFENESEFLRFLKDELDIGWAENAEFNESDDDRTIHIFKGKNSATIMFDEKEEGAILKINDRKTYYLKLEYGDYTINKLWAYKFLDEIPYLFSWNNIPGNDSDRFLRFLKDELDIGWAENAEILKRYDGIHIFKDKNRATILFDEKGEGATLKIRDGKTYYLKEEDDMLNIYEPKTQDKRLQAKSYNILINLPQNRHKYSQLMTLPHPYPDVTSVRGNSPTLSWHFTPNNRSATRMIIPSYQIQWDKYMITLDILTIIAVGLGVISIALAVKGYKLK